MSYYKFVIFIFIFEKFEGKNPKNSFCKMVKFSKNSLNIDKNKTVLLSKIRTKPVFFLNI